MVAAVTAAARQVAEETQSPLSMRVILGLYRDNGKESGNYYLGLRV